MRPMLRTFLYVLIFAVTSLPASAQEQDDDIICAGGARFWHGDMDDVRNIAPKPVPDSYQGVFESTGCSRWSLVVPSLLHWHRRVGSEDSMTAAIEYLSRDLLEGLDSETVVSKVGAYGTISNYYVIGAEAFESRPLIKQAEKYLDKAQTLARTLPSEERTSWYNSEFSGVGNYYNNERNFALGELSRDIAVNRALITELKADAEKAVDGLKTVNIPALQEFLDTLSDERPTHICEDDLEDRSDELSQACEDYEDEYFTDIRIFLTQKTLLSTVQDRHSVPLNNDKSRDLLYDMTLLLTLGETDDGSVQLNTINTLNVYDFAKFRLHLAFADMYFHLSERRYAASGAEGYFQWKYDLGQGLDHLLLAERYAPRHTIPSQWKRIAERYVSNAKFNEDWLISYAKSREDDGGIYAEWGKLDADRQMQLAYFEDGLKILQTNFSRPSDLEKRND